MTYQEYDLDGEYPIDLDYVEKCRATVEQNKTIVETINYMDNTYGPGNIELKFGIVGYWA